MAIVSEPLTTLIALNRFGLGARPGDFVRATSDPRGFLIQELQPSSVALVSTGLPSSEAALQRVFEQRQRKKIERARSSGAAEGDTAQMPPPDDAPGEPMAGMDKMPSDPSGLLNSEMRDRKPKARPDNPVQDLYRDEVMARIRKQAQADAGFVERLVVFWSNHFAVSVAKGPLVRAAAGAFEREAIRPHVLGRFADMLRAVEQHPAMLFYLDNQRSIGPTSKAGRNRGKGLNENLAREILELHTLGVDGGYSQADVTSLARIITGWSFAGQEGRTGEPGRFLFRANWHEPGIHPMLGKSYAEGGLSQGEAALTDLAWHPATAKHVAAKLVRHFVTDAPPQSLVDRLAKVFRDTEGDLAALATALVQDDDSWSPPPTKIRSPVEFMIAITRATNVVPEKPQPMLSSLRAMGMNIWQPPGPNGFPDTAEAWASPEGMKARLEVSWRAAQQAKTVEHPLAVLETVAGGAASRETHEAMSRAGSRQQALAILFMSPEFQRR